MIARKTAWGLYGVFLLAFGAYKYLIAAPPEFSIGYMVSVAILVVLTGVIPFVVAAWLAGKMPSPAGQWVVAIAVALIVCCAGYASYWALFIAPTGADVPMQAVALRGIYPGAIEGILAGLLAGSRKS
ncbi:hypothetical protein [uncultured Erythrobacter sp.]|uniref:hypothetical protein n=1 Tax=uncultured Erythrobacter sp. TaxID=263913 RepID=UPI00260A426F|nr:hypothetical protein [uncultured Erythrobacter sp.]